MRDLFRLLFNKRFRKTILMFIGFTTQFWWMGKRKKYMSQQKRDDQYQQLYHRQAVKYTKTATEMGGLLIKLGQFVSSRVDILPKPYTDQLSKLQDSVLPVDSKIMIERIEEELKAPLNTIFPLFEEVAVASASLGQVHRATLQNGDVVAVKVMRPGIENIIVLDLKTLKVMMRFAKRFTKMAKYIDLDEIYKEFKEVITDELDYQKEGKNAEAFEANFIGLERVTTPKIHWTYSTKKVLTMEFIEGVKINDVEVLEQWGISRENLAGTLFTAYLKQVMADGFFHADPHPGNILVKQDGTVVFIDFGMVGYIKKEMKEDLFKLVMAVYLKDADGIVDTISSLGFLRQNVDSFALTKSIEAILENFDSGSIDFVKLKGSDLEEDLREFLYQQPFQIPSQTTFLGKSVLTVFGICNELDRNFDLIEMTKPYVQDMIMNEDAGFDFSLDNIVEQGKKVLFTAIPTVRKVIKVVENLESGRLRVQPSLSFEKQMMEQNALSTKRIINTIVSTGIMITGSILFVGEFMYPGLLLMGVGLLSVLVLLIGKGRTTEQKRERRRQRHRKMSENGPNFKKPKFHP